AAEIGDQAGDPHRPEDRVPQRRQGRGTLRRDGRRPRSSGVGGRTHAGRLLAWTIRGWTIRSRREPTTIMRAIHAASAGEARQAAVTLVSGLLPSRGRRRDAIARP